MPSMMIVAASFLFLNLLFLFQPAAAAAAAAVFYHVSRLDFDLDDDAYF
jgi:hypothetical protein